MRVKEAAVKIQSSYRGHLGRQRASFASEQEAEAKRQLYFNSAATLIQCCWRGHFSRKWTHSFYARKAYLSTVLATNCKVQEDLQHFYDMQRAALYSQQEEETREKFAHTIKGLHHLVSTEVCPGIYYSPFAAVLGGPPMIAGKAVEQHLRGARLGTDSLPSVHPSRVGERTSQQGVQVFPYNWVVMQIITSKVELPG